MTMSGGAVEFPMIRKGIGFTAVVSPEAIEAAAGCAMALDDRTRWVEENMVFFADIADRIRPLLTPRGARVFVEPMHIAARGFA